MFLQKFFFIIHISVANLPQRPANSFVNQVFFVIELDFRNFQNNIKFIFSDKIGIGNDGDSSLP
jgi:hypothetical protein